VTALERGSASARWRDFGDIFVMTGRRSKAFANPVIAGSANDLATWDPGQRAWSRAG
jgi:hypothetical protein